MWWWNKFPMHGWMFSHERTQRIPCKGYAHDDAYVMQLTSCRAKCEGTRFRFHVTTQIIGWGHSFYRCFDKTKTWKRDSCISNVVHKIDEKVQGEFMNLLALCNKYMHFTVSPTFYLSASYSRATTSHKHTRLK